MHISLNASVDEVSSRILMVSRRHLCITDQVMNHGLASHGYDAVMQDPVGLPVVRRSWLVILGSLSKHSVDYRENDIGKCSFEFLPSVSQLF